MINKYENCYILKGSLTEEQALKETEIIKGYFKGAEIYEEENDRNGYQGRKKLAYDIKKQSEGYYVVFTFEANPEFISELERIYRITDSIMKFITVRKED